MFERTRVRGDGHCLFRTMSMELWGTQNKHGEIREQIVEHIVGDWSNYVDRITYTYGEQYKDPKKYSSFMGDINRREYGSEVEINGFCTLFKKNAAIYRLIDSENQALHLTNNQDMFLVVQLNHYPTLTNNRVNFLFSGLLNEEESRGHYDLLTTISKFNTGENEIELPIEENKVCPTHFIEVIEKEMVHDANVAEQNDILSSPSRFKNNVSERVSIKRDKKTICKAFAEYLISNKYSATMLQKNSSVARQIFKKSSEYIFGETKEKHIISLRRMYYTNYLNIQQDIKSQNEHAKQLTDINSKFTNEKMNNIVKKIYGSKVSKEFLISDKNCFSKVLHELCTYFGWNLNNPKNIKKGRVYWNKYLTHLTLSTSEEDDDVKLVSNGCIEQITVKKHVWDSTCKTETKIKSLKDEIISCHRRYGGVCSWKKHEEAYLTGAPKILNNLTYLTFKDCVFEECENSLTTTFDRKNPYDITINVRESSKSTKGWYDINGHYEYYKKQRIPFDRMDDIIYRNRRWGAVFGGNVEQLFEEQEIKTPAESTVLFGADECDEIEARPKSKSLSNQEFQKSKTNSPIIKGIDLDEKSLDNEIVTPLEACSDNIEITSKSKPIPKTWCNYKYRHFEGTVSAKSIAIFEDSKFNMETLKIWLRKIIIEKKKIYCRLIFTNTKQRFKSRINYVLYARCGSNIKYECKDYKFEVLYSEKINVRIWSRGPLKTIHCGRPKAYQIRGIQRAFFKEKLTTEDAKTVQNEEVKTLIEEAKVELNMQTVATLLTLRKIRSEAFKKDDLHEDDLIDVILRGKLETLENKEDVYIRKISAQPFLMHLYTDEQKEMIIKNNIEIAFFDATGSVARNMLLTFNRSILYYALVINVNSEVVPVAELLSEAQDIPTIADFFLSYKYYCLKSHKNKWPLIKRIVCDWSWAIMIGVVTAWNSMNLLQYLQFCNSIINGLIASEAHADKVTIHACCAHFMKMVSDRISKQNVSKTVKKFIMRVMANMVMCDKISNFDDIYRSFVSVILSEKCYVLTSSALSNLERLFENTECEFIDTMENFDDSDKEDKADDDFQGLTGRTKIDSPFFVKYEGVATTINKQLETARENEKENESVNTYYFPTFFDYFQNHLIPLLPFWTGLMIVIHKSPEDFSGRFSNANVENFFQQVKRRILKSKRNLKVGRLVNILRNNVVVSLKNVRVNLAEYNKEKKSRRKKGNGKKIVIKRTKVALTTSMDDTAQKEHKSTTLHNVPENNSEEDIDDPNVEEMWSKKRKSSHSYFISPHKNTKLLTHDNEIERSSLTNAASVCVDNIRSSILAGNTDDNENNIDHREVNVKNENRIKFRISIHKEYPHQQAMGNALFPNPSFYTDVETADTYVVSILKNLTPTKTLKLFGNEYSSLNGPQELLQGAIDACIGAIVKSLGKEHVVKYVNIETTHFLFRDKPVTVASQLWSYFRNLKKYEVIIMPYLIRINCNTNHYCLLIGDLKDKICLFYNSLPRCGDNSINGHQRFRKFLSSLIKTQYGEDEFEVNKWTFSEAKGVTQEDSYNCGVFIIQFVERWLSGEEVNIKFDPIDYRNYLRMLCLRQSENMSDLCLYCGKGETKCQVWTMCEACKRWVHYKPCLRHLNISLPTVKSENFVFQCDLCNNYYTKYEKDPWESC